jgi:glycosyl hydrolase family 26
MAVELCMGAMLTGCHRGPPPENLDEASAGSDVALAVEGAAPIPAGALLEAPPRGGLYHAVYPGSAANPGSEDAIAPADVDSYEEAVGHRVAWVYFSHEWAHGEAFPLATAEWIRARGSVPFVRLMMRTVPETGRTSRETKYALTTIVAGQHDAALAAWGDAVRAFGTPIVAEWGTEMNGEWFSWNASHNGGARGAALFKETYRHIVSVVRDRGARNVTWVFHVNGDDEPTNGWNRFEAYYPGAEWVDWLGFSAYGAQSPEGPCPAFVSYVDAVVARLTELAAGKPIFLLEFGTTAKARACEPDPAGWTRAALDALVGGRWPSVRGFAWWNEGWDNGPRRAPTDMRVQDSPELADAFRRALARGVTVDRPTFR